VRRLAKFEPVTAGEDWIDALLKADCDEPLEATVGDLVVQLDGR
jgi:hypothetical protein